MSKEHNPQGEQMASDAMVRNLVAQATAIWPQERELFGRYGEPTRILDLACGTGEITARLAERYPSAQIVGIDLDPAHLVRARERCGDDERLQFQVADAYHLPEDDGAFDLVVCRSLLQSVPDAAAVMVEMARVTTPGGWMHVLVEDYAMLHFHPVDEDIEAFWRDGPRTHAAQLGVDLDVGRKGPVLARAAGLVDVRQDYVVVDTLRVDPEVFATILACWHDAFAGAIAEHTRFSREELDRCWDAMLGCIRNPDGYGVWQVPIVSGRKV